jgi:hypothetical protein
MRFGCSSARGIDQADAFAKRKACAYNGQTAGLAYIHGHSIGALLL